MVAVHGSGRPDATLGFFPNIISGIGYRFFIVYELNAADRDRAVGALKCLGRGRAPAPRHRRPAAARRDRRAA